MNKFILTILIFIPLFTLSAHNKSEYTPTEVGYTQKAPKYQELKLDTNILVKFFLSYNDKTFHINYNYGTKIDKINLIYNNHKESTLINPYNIALDSLPDSVRIECSKYCYPTKSKHITSRFGIRGSRFHYGIDIGVKHGDTIRTPFSGIIRYVDYQRGGYGKYIIIRHDNGIESIMAHFSRTLVKIGQRVEAGDVIGLGGSTGRSTGPHLHLEFRLLGNAFNPEKIIDFESTKVNIQENENCNLLTLTDTYYHRRQLEEIKRAAYHRVRSGETLSHIARRYGTSIRRLCALNNIKETSIIRIGQSIRYR